MKKLTKKIFACCVSVSMLFLMTVGNCTITHAAGLPTEIERYFCEGYLVGDTYTLAYDRVGTKHWSGDPIVNGNNVDLPGNGLVCSATVPYTDEPLSAYGNVYRKNSNWSRATINVSDYVETGVLTFKFRISNASYIPYLYAYLADAQGSAINRVGANFSEQYTEEDVNTWKVINIPLKKFIGNEGVYKYSDNLDISKIHGAGIMFPNAYEVQEEMTFYFDDMHIRNVLPACDLEVVSSDNDSAKISWNASLSEIDKYEVLRDGVVIAETAGDVLEYEDCALESMQTYKYTVRAKDSYGAVSNCTEEVEVFTSPTGRPNNLSVTSGFADVLKAVLTWEEPEYGVIKSYQIYRDDEMIAEVGNDCFEYEDIDGVQNYTKYNYYVVAISEDDIASMPSNTVSIYVANIMYPEGLQAEVIEQDIKLSWNSVDAAGMYFIYCNGKKIAETTECEYLHEGIEYATCYTYAVTSKNVSGQESIQSKEVLIAPMSPTLTSGDKIFTDSFESGFSAEPLNDSEFDIDRNVKAVGNASLKVDFATGSHQIEGLKLKKNIDLSDDRINGGVLGFYLYAEDSEQVKDVKIALECTSDEFGGSTYTARTYIDISQYITVYGMWNYVQIPIKDFPALGTYMSGISQVSQKFKFNQTNAVAFFVDEAQYMESKTIFIDDFCFATDSDYVVSEESSEVELSMNSATVTSGSNVSTTVKVVSENVVANAFEIIFNYDSSILSVNSEDSVTLSQKLKDTGATVLLESGSVRISLSIPEGSIELDEELAKINFKTIKTGTSQLSVSGLGTDANTDEDFVFTHQGSSQIKVIAPTNGGGSSSGGGGSTGGGRNTATVYPTVSIPVSGIENGNKDNAQEQKDAFEDIDEVEWAKEAINVLYEKGYITGYSDSEFRPNNNVTREEFIKMILSALSSSVTVTDECTFGDTEKDAWYYDYLAVAERDGIITGYDGKFGVGEFITRQDMCTIALRAADTYKVVLRNNYGVVVFDDADEIADYAEDAIMKLYAAGVVNGVGEGKFEPQSNVTRAMAAKIVYELLKLKS